MLVRCALDLVRLAEGTSARMFLPDRAVWAEAALRGAGFVRVRTIAHMQLPPTVPSLAIRPIAGITIRSIAAGEDDDVLAALNRNWQGTWNFVSITPSMLASDLAGQRDGMWLSVDTNGQIVATCHAMFETSDDSLAQGPQAWISNLTVAPEVRQRGLGRAMLAAGIAYLRAHGAGVITLGVDADEPAPYSLYRSVGFQVISSLNAWDRDLAAPVTS
jgi:ribosomal protein S18 acetylase RimI-like enzyme